MMKKIRTFLLVTIFCLALSACNDIDSESHQAVNPHEFVLTSTEMSNGGHLPVAFTCDGSSISPPLSWSGAPIATKYFALIMDHDAPDRVHWYWTMYNISSDITQIKSGETHGQVGTNGVNGLNEYAPPCSKGPGKKNYTYTVYALSAPVNVNDNTKVDRSTLLTAISDTILGSAQMSVSYERSDKGSDHNNVGMTPPAKSDLKPNPKESQFQQPDLSVNVDSPRCATIQKSVSDAGFKQSVTVVCDENYAYVASSTYPAHEVMTGITGTNEQIPVPALGYAAPVKLKPKKAAELTTIDAAVGVAVNGVPIYDYSSQGELDVHNYDSKHDTLALGQLDICGGHSGRGDDYHYHVSPTCMINTMANQTSEAIIGWAYDGYPLYGNKNPDGSNIADGELDVCNGQADETFGYRYQTSDTPPYIIQCLVGEVDTSQLPRVSPLSGDTQKIRAELRPPKGGVENLKHTASEDGSRTMTYSYQGKEYFTTYSLSTKIKNCYDFKQKTISNGDKVETGTFCRGPQPSEQTKNTDVKPKPAAAAKLELSVAEGKYKPNSGTHNLRLEAWADNWFAAYIGDDLLIEDSVSITTERSFNAESITFSTNYPIQLNLVLKDFKENDTGLEYIGARNQQMGDGGLILQITDTDTHKVIAVSNDDWKCQVLHKAPLDKLCESEPNPVAGEGYCGFISKEAPTNWLQSNFDDSTWPDAIEHSFSSVGPKDGYDEINWDQSAKFIWGDDLETDNTLICRITIEQPQ